jgi:hypothetical protein
MIIALGKGMGIIGNTKGWGGKTIHILLFGDNI